MQAGERVMRPEVRARPGSLAPLGRLWVGEGGRLGKGWGGHSHSRGRVGLGTQGCGLALPGTVHSRLGPPPSRLMSPWAGSDTLTQKLSEGQKDPFDSVHRHGIGGTLGRGPRKQPPGCGGKSQLLPSDPRACKREQRTVRRSGRRTCPKVFTGGWNRSNHWKGGFSLCQDRSR